ncbi:MAG: hypothetical protein IJY58_00675 [Alphaproteobacteria bacterium]|nr:hypothetical protein [Alphaproteobacteria bacterium]
MKRILRLLAFLTILVVTGFLTRIPAYAHIIFPVCMTLSVLVFLFAVYYVKCVLKKDIFVWVLFIFLIATMGGTPVWAQSIGQKNADAVDKAEVLRMRNYITQNKNAVCEVDKDGKATDAADNQMYDPKTLEKAQTIYSYAKLLQGQQVSFNDEALTCAESYINKAASVQKGFSQKCSPITTLVKTYLNEDSCWPCDITGLMLASIQRVAVASYDVVRSMSLMLLGVLFLFWLAYVTLAFFGKFGFARISEYLTNVLNKAVIVIIVAALLHAPLVNVYRMVVSPFVQYAASLAITFSEIGSREVKKGGNLVTEMARFIGGSAKCKWCSQTGDMTVASNQFLDQGTVNAMLCTVCSVYKQVSPMIALGQAITCYSTSAPKSFAAKPSMSESGSAYSFPSISGLFVGLLFVILFSLLMVVVGFYIMSATMKLGFVLVLTPVWLVLFVFKGTRTYTSKAWILIVHSMVTLVAISIAVSMILIGFTVLLPTKTIIGFIIMSIKSSPTQMLSSFAGVLDGKDPLSDGSDSADGGSWASGITDTLVDSAISSITDFSPLQTMIVFASFAFLSIQILDKASTIVERLTNSWINLGNTGVSAMVKGSSTGLSTVAHIGKAGGTIVTGVAGFAAGRKLTQELKESQVNRNSSSRFTEETAEARNDTDKSKA